MVIKLTRNTSDNNINHILSLNSNGTTRGELRIGDYLTSGSFLTINTAGNVGIGTTSPGSIFPNSRLDVTGFISNRGSTSQGNVVLLTADHTQTGYINFYCVTSGNVNRRLGYVGFGDSVEGRGLSIYTDTGTYMNFYTNGTERMRIASSGNVGIGTINPTFQLQLSTDSAAKLSTNVWSTTSDERLKENIEFADLDTCYNIIKNLPLKRYRWKNNTYTDEQITDRNVVGFIAQDVALVFPKAVNSAQFTNIDGTVIDNCLNLNETMIIRSLYGAVQKTMSKLETTKTELNIVKQFLQNKFPGEYPGEI